MGVRTSTNTRVEASSINLKRISRNLKKNGKTKGRRTEVVASRKAVEAYLKKAYLRILTPDEESGTFAAEIPEFPGCVAQGDTPQEAYANLEKVAVGWIEAALDLGQKIPEPTTETGYGGKVALRLPRSLHRPAAIAAERDGASLNQFIVSALSQK